jgi:hypothetical protein
MSKEIVKHEISLPTLQELYADPSEIVKSDQLQAILNLPPPADWIKTHPYIAGYKYLPIDKIEFLLKRIFKRYRIEVLREGTSFNGVFCVVRVHYLHPITGEWDFHDGIGAEQLQTAKGKSAADLANINQGAIGMAFPIAKTRAIKDACDHFGTTFGSDLNRKDTLQFEADPRLAQVARTKEEERMAKLIEKAKDTATLEALKTHLTDNLQAQFDIKWKSLSK